MKKFIVSLVAITALVSCKKDKETVTTENNELKIDSVVVKDSSVVNKNLTLEYSTSLLVFPTIKEKPLQDSIYFWIDSLQDFTKTGLQKHADNAKNKFYKGIEKDWVEDQDHPDRWYENSKMKVLSQEHQYLQLEYFVASYMGGAHGNYGFFNRVFDLQNKKTVVLSDITTMSEDKLSALLMQNIDTKTSAATDQDGEVKNSEMLLVEKIPTTRNFYFDQNNLYFHYSPYEITAYAAGDVLIPISWQELASTLTPEFKKRMGL